MLVEASDEPVATIPLVECFFIPPFVSKFTETASISIAFSVIGPPIATKSAARKGGKRDKISHELFAFIVPITVG